MLNISNFFRGDRMDKVKLTDVTISLVATLYFFQELIKSYYNLSGTNILREILVLRGIPFIISFVWLCVVVIKRISYLRKTYDEKQQEYK